MRWIALDWLVALAYCVGLVWIGWCFLCYFRPPIRSPHAEQHTGHSRLCGTTSCGTTSLMRVNIASSSTSGEPRIRWPFFAFIFDFFKVGRPKRKAASEGSGASSAKVHSGALQKRPQRKQADMHCQQP